MRKILVLFIFFAGFVLPGYAEEQATDTDILTLEWLDLIPEQERNVLGGMGQPVPLNHSGDAPAQSTIGSVRPELNGSTVKIAGFVIPLEGDDKTVTEFLLVPFLGACIHVPPPPPNQIIYVRFKDGAPIQQLWDVVYIIGTLKTEAVSHDLAEVGYVIEGTALEEYEEY
ncbi:DUF3299 domain-containing protein [Vibrio albus]|jgi:hypothetical protein|uniref:DUF3299 domain-containing protein n=1 Tax=Vibrio albus TaxID=2200953 RepID=A0A2U3BA12_9VIBR|nr:DUF3299 domain-containing protein [Vibrio albus]PWI33639.1 DUF3299 domain-containing protein [Vibrio albus]